MNAPSREIRLQVHTRSEAETRHFAQRLAQLLQPGDVIALEGELGAGKTCLVRGLAEGLGIDASQVSSPTFVLIHEYPSPIASRPTLVHVDAYRLGGPGDLESIGFGELLQARDAIVAIEWPSRIQAALPHDRITLSLDVVGESERLIRLSAPGLLGDRLSRVGATSIDTPNARRVQCRMCGKVIDAGVRTYPFCSDRCRMADLGGWFAEGYRVMRPMQSDDELSE